MEHKRMNLLLFGAIVVGMTVIVKTIIYFCPPKGDQEPISREALQDILNRHDKGHDNS